MAFKDYLDVVVPNYIDEVFIKSANFDMPMPGAYKQVRNETDGDNPKVVTMKSTPDSTINLRFTGVEQDEYDEIEDFYYNTGKAYGMARSYIWQNPQTLDLYTVQNVSEFKPTATVMSYGRYDISFTIKILGVPGLIVLTSGQTVDFEYAGTAYFITKYPDDTESLLTNPPLKDFGSVANREIFITIDGLTEVTSIDLGGSNVYSVSSTNLYANLLSLYIDDNDITDPPDISSNTVLTTLDLRSTDLTTPPDITNNLLLEYLYLTFTNIVAAPGVLNNTALITLDLSNCSITEASLSSCVDELYINRIALGGNFCVIELSGNNGLTADAIAKIDGTGAYIGDGLIDAGCSVTY